MMATTHAFLAVALAALATPVLAVPAPAALVAAAIGGVVPDLDIVADHRRTLHFPVGYTLLAVGFGAIAFVVPASAVILCTVGVAAAALHAISDVFGGSPESEPWNPTREVAVYNHVLGQWHHARRWVRYSGAPEDCLVGGIFAVGAIATPGTGPTADAILLAVLAFSVFFTLARKRLGTVATLTRRIGRIGLRSTIPETTAEENQEAAISGQSGD